MNKKQEKALETIKEELQDQKEAFKYYKGVLGVYSNGKVEILLKLIEELNTELEIRIAWQQYFEKEYINKDKIREKIKHYNNELEHIKNGEEFENEEPMYYWGKVALENLLEEK